MSLIPTESLDEGIQLCLANAERLLNDAQHLNGEERYSSAMLLAAIAIEEAGKGLTLLRAKENNKNLDNGEQKKVFRLHQFKIKQALAGVPHLRLDMKTRMPQHEIEEIARTVTDAVDSAKLEQTYVDWKKGRWHSPTMTDKTLLRGAAANQIGTAEVITDSFKAAIKGEKTSFAVFSGTVVRTIRDGNDDECGETA